MFAVRDSSSDQLFSFLAIYDGFECSTLLTALYTRFQLFPNYKAPVPALTDKLFIRSFIVRIHRIMYGSCEVRIQNWRKGSTSENIYQYRCISSNISSRWTKQVLWTKPLSRYHFDLTYLACRSAIVRLQIFRVRSCEEQKKNSDKVERDVSHFCRLSTPALLTNLSSNPGLQSYQDRLKEQREFPIYIVFSFGS